MDQQLLLEMLKIFAPGVFIGLVVAFYFNRKLEKEKFRISLMQDYLKDSIKHLLIFIKLFKKNINRLRDFKAQIEKGDSIDIEKMKELNSYSMQLVEHFENYREYFIPVFKLETTGHFNAHLITIFPQDVVNKGDREEILSSINSYESYYLSFSFKVNKFIDRYTGSTLSRSFNLDLRKNRLKNVN